MTYKEIVNRCEEVCGVPENSSFLKTRKQEYYLVRIVEFYILRKNGLSLTTIGNIYNQDHSTVCLGLNNFTNYITGKSIPKDKNIIDKYIQILNEFKDLETASLLKNIIEKPKIERQKELFFTLLKANKGKIINDSLIEKILIKI